MEPTATFAHDEIIAATDGEQRFVNEFNVNSATSKLETGSLRGLKVTR